jgi:predicted RNase H-like nuclease (RuvC/YqgF family)
MTTNEQTSDITTYKSSIAQLEKKIEFLEDTNLKLSKDKDRLIRDFDNHLKANIGERTGVDQLKLQYAEQHTQNASLIVHNRLAWLI